MMLVDSHCHLDYLPAGPARAETIARARRAGVGAMLTIGTKITEFPAVRAIAEENADVWCSVGIHPHEAEAEPETPAERLASLAAHPKVVGIGETGLDFYYEHSPRERQIEVFRAHAAAARATGLPLIVHTRDAGVAGPRQHAGLFCRQFREVEMAVAVDQHQLAAALGST